MEFSLMRILTMVSDFFISIMGQVFSIEFFHNFAFGKVALVVLSVCLAFDVFLQIFGRQMIDGAGAVDGMIPRASRSYVTERQTNTATKDASGKIRRYSTKSSTRTKIKRK